MPQESKSDAIVECYCRAAEARRMADTAMDKRERQISGRSSNVGYPWPMTTGSGRKTPATSKRERRAEKQARVGKTRQDRPVVSIACHANRPYLIRMIADHRSPPSIPSKVNAGKPWAKTDLLFLKVSVESGECRSRRSPTSSVGTRMRCRRKRAN